MWASGPVSLNPFDEQHHRRDESHEEAITSEDEQKRQQAQQSQSPDPRAIKPRQTVAHEQENGHGGMGEIAGSSEVFVLADVEKQERDYGQGEDRPPAAPPSEPH